jgi:hypothetical protein
MFSNDFFAYKYFFTKYEMIVTNKTDAKNTSMKLGLILIHIL